MKKSRLYKLVAAAALAMVALVGVPAAATAVDPYTPTPGDSGIVVTGGTPAPGASVRLAFVPGFFSANERVTFTLIGQGVGPNSLATFLTVDAPATLTRTAGADGALGVNVTFPADAACTYTLTDSGTNPAFSHTRTYDLGNCSNGLATTGAGTGSDQLLALWIGGGALAFIGGGLLVATAVRKQRRQLAE